MRRKDALRFAAGLALLASACVGPDSAGVTVSGKTAFRGMGVEGVRVRAYPAEGEPGRPVAETRSGYHGSFRLRLRPGAYVLVADGALPAGPEALSLRGQTEVRIGPERRDRVVIPLSETAP